MQPELDVTQPQQAIMAIHNVARAVLMRNQKPSPMGQARPAEYEDFDELVRAVSLTPPQQWADKVWDLVESNPGRAPNLVRMLHSLHDPDLSVPQRADEPQQTQVPPSLPNLRAVPISDAQGGFVWARPGARVVVQEQSLAQLGLTRGSPLGTIEAVDVDGSVWVALDVAGEAPATELTPADMYLSKANTTPTPAATEIDVQNWWQDPR